MSEHISWPYVMGTRPLSRPERERARERTILTSSTDRDDNDCNSDNLYERSRGESFSGPRCSRPTGRCGDFVVRSLATSVGGRSKKTTEEINHEHRK